MNDPLDPAATDAGDVAPPSPAPTDTALSGVVDTLDGEGWSGQFRALDDARVECLTCHVVIPADQVGGDELTRLEGASDPADMAVVLPVRCPRCGTRGSLVLAYGPNASAEEADVLAALDRRRPAEGDPTRTATPGVVADHAAHHQEDPAA